MLPMKLPAHRSNASIPPSFINAIVVKVRDGQVAKAHRLVAAPGGKEWVRP